MLNGLIGLVADVPHAEERDGDERDDDGDHHPLQVDVVAHVRLAVSDFARRVEERVKRLVHRVRHGERSAFVEQRMDFVQSIAEKLSWVGLP